MTNPKLILSLLQETLAICRLDRDAGIPDWALTGGFFSITRTPDELSIVCPQSSVPEEIPCDREWQCLRVEGPLALSLTGILASLAAPLARAGISTFVVSTYDTDYVMVKEKDVEQAILVLSQEGHQVRRRRGG
ncbi:MAG: ACT domain-containing protein [Deltaproteobacteria bacterium]|nr:ACT domain-containing protein [Deltaproteobacteria bacterium]MBW2306119.1 ACT domain-containing protein [Deltaproteobacteria bacterium]